MFDDPYINKTSLYSYPEKGKIVKEKKKESVNLAADLSNNISYVIQ